MNVFKNVLNTKENFFGGLKVIDPNPLKQIRKYKKKMFFGLKAS